MTKSKAQLRIENNELVLEIIPQDKKEPKTIYIDRYSYPLLDELAKLLEFTNTKELLSNINLGDELTFDLNKDYESEKPVSLEEVKSLYEGNIQAIDDTLEEELQAELKNNYRLDMAASAVEIICEAIAYRVFLQIKDLALDKLILEESSIGQFPRLIDVIGQNANEVEIEVEIK